MFKGSMVAMVTPFSGEQLDRAALARLLERQLAAGTHGVVIGGTTGETPTLTQDELRQAVELARQVIAGRVPLIVGTGTNCTRTTIERTQAARALGADAALVVVPYYNKPTAEGLVAHFGAVAEQGGLPVVAYNIPGRTGVKPSLATLLRIGALPNVVAIKEASDDLSLAGELVAELGDRVALLSGEDPSSLYFWAAGGVGTISVTANVDPGRCARMWETYAAGDLPSAQRLQRELMPLHRALFWETNPIPCKEALAQLGLCSPELRLPLTRLSAELRPKLTLVLQKLGLLEGPPA